MWWLGTVWYGFTNDTRDECLKHVLTEFACSQVDALVGLQPVRAGGGFIQSRCFDVLRQLTILVVHVLTSELSPSNFCTGRAVTGENIGRHSVDCFTPLELP